VVREKGPNTLDQDSLDYQERTWHIYGHRGGKDKNRCMETVMMKSKIMDNDVKRLGIKIETRKMRRPKILDDM
jgi:hypothetical protein